MSKELQHRKLKATLKSKCKKGPKTRNVKGTLESQFKSNLNIGISKEL